MRSDCYQREFTTGFADPEFDYSRRKIYAIPPRRTRAEFAALLDEIFDPGCRRNLDLNLAGAQA